MNQPIFENNYCGECSVILDDDRTINVTLLLKNANLTHLNLGEDLIEKMGGTLNQFLPEAYSSYKKERPEGVGALAKLHPVLKQAVTFMTGNDHYKNVNALCRGQWLKTEENRLYSDVAFSSLILVGLTAEALNQLPGLLDDPKVYLKEKAILKKLAGFHLKTINSHDEYEQILTQAKKDKHISRLECRLMQGRYEELWPSVCSLTVYRRERSSEGLSSIISDNRLMRSVTQNRAPFSTSLLPHLVDFGDIVIQFQNMPRGYLSIASLSAIPNEQEILLPSSQVIYLPISDKKKCSQAPRTSNCREANRCHQRPNRQPTLAAPQLPMGIARKRLCGDAAARPRGADRACLQARSRIPERSNGRSSLWSFRNIVELMPRTHVAEFVNHERVLASTTPFLAQVVRLLVAETIRV